MNCAELQADINRLKDSRADLQASLDSLNETGLGKNTLKNTQAESLETADKLLEKYLANFNEKNLELLMKFESSPYILEKVEDGRRVSCSRDGSVLVSIGHSKSLTYFYNDDNNEWKREDNFEAPFEPADILLVDKNHAFLSDDKSHCINEFSRSPSGEWLESNAIIDALRICQTRDGFLVSSAGDSELREISANNLHETEKIALPFYTKHLCSMPDDSIIASPDYNLGYLISLKKNNGTWETTKQKLQSPPDELSPMEGLYITSVNPLPKIDDAIVVNFFFDHSETDNCSYWSSELYKLNHETNSWKNIRHLSLFNGAYFSSTTTPDGNLLCVDYKGNINELNMVPGDLTTLKKNLDKIVATGDS